MSRPASIARHVQIASVLALGAFAVHQLRYLAADGGQAGERLAHDGHAYLAAALPVLAGFALSALAATVLAARAGSGGTVRRPGLLAYGLALLSIYCGQELIEGALSAGHPDGLGALLANSGWVALPLAFALGLVVSLVVRALEGIEAVLVELLGPAAAGRTGRARGSSRPRTPSLTPLAPLAFGLARRPPPAVATTSH